MTFLPWEGEGKGEKSHRAELAVEIVSISPLPSHFVCVSHRHPWCNDCNIGEILYHQVQCATASPVPGLMDLE